jgi:hypothetical protein
VPVPGGAPSEFTADFDAPPTDAFVDLSEGQADPALLAELPDPLPADIAALGTPLVVFRYRGGVSPIRLFLGGLVLAGGMNLSLGLAFAYFSATTRRSDDLVFILSFAGPLVFLGGCYIARVLGIITLRVFIFSGGFIRRSCFRQRVCHWSQVRWAQRLWVPLSWQWVYRVEQDNGRFYYFDNRLDRLDELGRIILRQTTSHLLQRALADHDAGRPVHFNEFKVSQTGVSRGRDGLPWQRIRVAQRLKTRVWVWQWDREKPWVQVDADELAHPDVFVGLVNTVLAERRDSPR